MTRTFLSNGVECAHRRRRRRRRLMSRIPISRGKVGDKGTVAGRRTDGRAGGGETGSGRRAEAASEYRARLISSPIGRNNALLSPPLLSSPSPCQAGMAGIMWRGNSRWRGHRRRLSSAAHHSAAAPARARVVSFHNFGGYERASVCDHRGSFSFWHRLSPGLPNYSMRELSASPPVAASPGIARVGRLRYFARRIRGRDKCSLILPFLFV